MKDASTAVSAESIERGADSGWLCDQPQGNKPGGHRADEDRCPAGRFGDRRGPCSLRVKMLGGHERDCAGPRRSAPACPVLAFWSLLVVSQLSARPRKQLSQQRPGRIPVSGSTRSAAGLWLWLVVKSGSGNDLDGEYHGDEPVDGGADGGHPPCACHVMAALLPESLETWPV